MVLGVGAKGSEVILWSSTSEFTSELLMELRVCVGVGKTDVNATLLSCAEVRLEVSVDVLACSITELVCSVMDKLTETPAVLTSSCRLEEVSMEDVVGPAEGKLVIKTGWELELTIVLREEVAKPVVDAITGVVVIAGIA